MHTRTLTASLAFLFLSACAAVTPPPVSTMAFSDAGPNPVASVNVEEVAVSVEESPVLCRYELITGSRIPKRTCRTKAQMIWEQARAADTTDRMSVDGPIGGIPKRPASAR
jgi:hypothetical protein